MDKDIGLKLFSCAIAYIPGSPAMLSIINTARGEGGRRNSFHSSEGIGRWSPRAKVTRDEKNYALQGNRTPANCLEGNYPTTGPAMP